MTAQKQRGSIGIYLFACAFLIPGVLVALWGLMPVFKYLSSESWEEVNIYMVNVEQVISQGDSSTSYGVKGLYRYRFNDQDYQSTQLNFYSGTDNIGDYQNRFYSRLKKHHENNLAITGWVNPDAPEEAYIDRTLRFGLIAFKLIFGLIFATVGASTIFFGRYMAKRSVENADLESRYPQEPWRWRKEWQSSVIKTNAGAGFRATAAFAIIWNLISIPVAAAVIFGEENHPLGIKLLILLFPLIGLFLIHLSYRTYRSWTKYGEAKLRMEPAPFSIGTGNAGEITIPGIRSGDDFILTLSCIEKTRRKSGNKTRTHTKILWQHDRRVKAGPGSDGIGKLEYTFSIPEGLPESRELSDRKSIAWQLTVKGAGTTKLDLEFKVPGFVTEQSNLTGLRTGDDQPVWNEDTIKPSANFFSSTTGDWKHLGVIQHKERGGIHYYFPPGRNLKMTLGFPIFGSIFLASGISLFFANAGWLFGIVFGGLGLLFTLIGLHGLLFRSEIRIADAVLYIRHGILSMSDKAECPASQIRKFKISSNMRSGNTRAYRLSVKLQNGEKILLGKNLLVKSDVESLVNRIHSDLELPSVPETTD